MSTLNHDGVCPPKCRGHSMSADAANCIPKRQAPPWYCQVLNLDVPDSEGLAYICIGEGLRSKHCSLD